MRKYLYLALLLTTIPASAAETLNFMLPPTGSGGYNVIPGETRRFFVKQGGAIGGATFSITSGTATIADSTTGYVDVKAPTTGGTCTISGSKGAWVITCAVTYTITATSIASGITDTVTVGVSSPTPWSHNVPSSRMGVYAGQLVNIQSYVLGQMDKSIVWSITTQPRGGDMAFVGGSTNRNAVVSATVPGRYVVTSTTNTGSITATTIIDIPTSATLPYHVTADGTEPFNCAVDSNLTGKVYEVGPGQAYADLNALPHNTTGWTLRAGSIIRIHTVSGSSPTSYANFGILQGQGTQAQPIVFCGIANATGYLPKITGASATTTINPNRYLTGFDQLLVYKSDYSYYGGSHVYPQYITVAGLDMVDANDTQSYTVSGNTCKWGQSPNSTNTACVGASPFVSSLSQRNGTDISFIGNRTQNSGLGLFSDAKGSQGGESYWLLDEGNNFQGYGYSDGTIRTGGVHGNYIQSLGQLVQGNQFGPAATTATGGTFKTRGVANVVRYNYLDANDRTTRVHDFPNQSDSCYTSSIQFLTSGNCSPATDAVPIWYLASWNEMFHDEEWLYGDISKSLSTSGALHYAGDQGLPGGQQPRAGTLNAYNNTHHFLSASGVFFDVRDPNFSKNEYEFPAISSRNSAYWADNLTTSVYFPIASSRYAILDIDHTVLPPTCCTNNQNVGSMNGIGSNSGWPISSNLPVTQYQITSGTTITLKIPSGQTWAKGSVATLGGFATSTFLNGLTATVTGGGYSSRITATLSSTESDTGLITENGYASEYSTYYYADYDLIGNHISGFGTNLSAIPHSVSTRPFDATTFVNSTITGAVLPAKEAVMPVQYQFCVTCVDGATGGKGYLIPRSIVVDGTHAGYVGAADGMGATLSSIALTSTSLTFLVGGSSRALTCVATLSDSSTKPCAAFGTVTWVSDTTGVATVDSAGNVSPVGAGSANITANIGAVYATPGPVSVTVTSASSSNTTFTGVRLPGVTIH